MCGALGPGILRVVGRITFAKSPWPNGHPIESFTWTAAVVDDRLRFLFDLKSAEYSAEVPGVEPKASDPEWAHPIVWNNYHACSIRADGTGFVAGTAREPLELGSLGGRTFLVDTKPKSHDDASFGIYLLGHDSIAKHEITFGGSGPFSIDWRAKICRSYVGERRYEHSMHARIDAASLAYVRVPAWEGDEVRARAALERVMRGTEHLLYVRRERGFAFAETR